MFDGDDVAINIHIVEDIAFIYLHKIDKLHSVHSSAFVLWQKSFFWFFVSSVNSYKRKDYKSYH